MDCEELLRLRSAALDRVVEEKERLRQELEELKRNAK